MFQYHTPDSGLPNVFRTICDRACYTEILGVLREKVKDGPLSLMRVTCLQRYRNDLNLLIAGSLCDKDLSPNAVMMGEVDSLPLLEAVIRNLPVVKSYAAGKDMVFDPDPLFGRSLGSDTPSSSREAYARIAKLLIERGADIYAIERPPSYRSMVETPCALARRLDVLDEWSAILQDSGFDPDKVFLEDERRLNQALRLRLATRSGVDESVLELPSIDGLRYRLCRRAYCDIRYRSIFDKS